MLGGDVRRKHDPRGVCDRFVTVDGTDTRRMVQFGSRRPFGVVVVVVVEVPVQEFLSS